MQNTTHTIRIILLLYLYDLYSILPLHHFQEGDGDGASFDEDDVSTKINFQIINRSEIWSLLSTINITNNNL